MFKKLTAAAAPVSVPPHGLRHPLVDSEKRRRRNKRITIECLCINMGGAVGRNVTEARKFEIVLQGVLLGEVNVLIVDSRH